MDTIDLSFIDHAKIPKEERDAIKNAILVQLSQYPQQQKEKGFHYGSMSAKGGDMKANFISETLLNSGGYFSKSDLEFSRYKQDCRKRALDVATEIIRTSGFQGAMHDAIITEADRYYNWLISIPE